MANTITREQWLESAVDKLRPIFRQVQIRDGKAEFKPGYTKGIELPRVRVSVGWPSRGGLKNTGKVIGQCWASQVAADGVHQIFVSPTLGGDTLQERVDLVGVLAHELIHAWDDCKSGHKGAFSRVARALGLEGRMTATTVGPELRERIVAILDELGPYPHSRLNVSDPSVKRQSTRMLKVQCPNDGYTLRTTAKWLDSLGTPVCPCGTKMEEAD